MKQWVSETDYLQLLNYMYCVQLIFNFFFIFQILLSMLHVCIEFQIEIRELKERLAVEKASWEENYMKKQETWMLQKERELKDQVRRDRDKEIELVISRLEEDASASREETEKAAEHRIRFVLCVSFYMYMNYFAKGIP